METGLVGPSGQQTPDVAIVVPDARLLKLADAAAKRFADYRFVALEEHEYFNLYATEPNACSSLFVDVRKRHADASAVAQTVTSAYAKSVQHLADVAYECRKSGTGTSFEVSYFGQPLFSVQDGRIAATHATPSVNQLGTLLGQLCIGRSTGHRNWLLVVREPDLDRAASTAHARDAHIGPRRMRRPLRSPRHRKPPV